MEWETSIWRAAILLYAYIIFQGLEHGECLFVAIYAVLLTIWRLENKNIADLWGHRASSIQAMPFNFIPVLLHFLQLKLLFAI